MSDPRVQELKSLLPRCLLADWVRLGARAARLFRDERHPARHDAVLERLLAQARDSAERCAWRRANVPVVTYPPDLPITARREEIVAAIRRHPVVIVAGETGSGKTTQLPKMCLEAGLGIEARVGCTQPRRVAALSISRRLAAELDVPWGREIGCQIRFDDRTGPETFIKLMTDGILLAEAQGDPLLTGYNALVIDEAHERSLNIDFLLGHLKGLVGRRPDLKVIITSATLDTGAFSRHFDNAPVIEVSGRMYPVSVRYAPPDSGSEERGELTCIEAAVQAVEGVLNESVEGDVLVFLPGERDIRETGDLLEGRCGHEAEIVPLYGRLSAGDQQRVFTPSGSRRVILATNIAETSLTLPGIRFVVDAGLARISRYNPRTRTRRLPVEPVSQSSANQRRGRAGRVREGVCIRLYSEEDFASRPPFTQPEIQRANLAEVILRMKAFRLGDIETFPFVNPPSAPAIEGGYQLLIELGALDETRGLTALGLDLARLPIDPTLGRMLLQAQQEHATRELLIIASGLAIQDPRERPLDKREMADAAHRRFLDPHSDFLTLLNLWNGVHDAWESLRSQGQRRRFCRDHFLSYVRMREWQDLHAQLHGALEELGTVNLNASGASGEVIHRAILSGLLAHVAMRTGRNAYTGTGNRAVQVFPGSVLFERFEPSAKGSRANRGRGVESGEPVQAEKTRQPAWIMAGEIVETSQRFARTLAGIEPGWIVGLAPHLCRTTHQNPRWSVGAGRVLVDEIVHFQGLEVLRRAVAYGNLQPAEATAIFIRDALVGESLLPPARDGGNEALDEAPADSPLPPQYAFLGHNRKIRQRVEDWQTRVRLGDARDPDEALYRFYAGRLSGVSSVSELNRVIRDASGPGFLCATVADLTDGREMGFDADAFPDRVDVAGHPVPVTYAYAPGESWDGVTLKVPAELLPLVPPSALEWAVPGLRASLVSEWLASLPKSLRRALQPFPPKVEAIVRDLRPAAGSLCDELGQWLHRACGVGVPPEAWRPESVPGHLRPRIEVVDADGRVLGAGRDPRELRRLVGTVRPASPAESPAWKRLTHEWERLDVSGWTFGDLPESVDGGQAAPGIPTVYPGLSLEGGCVHVRLFRTAASARAASRDGFQRLVERSLQKDLAWLEKDLRGLDRLHASFGSPATADVLRETAMDHIRRQVLPAEAPPGLTRTAFDAAVQASREQLRGAAPQLIRAVGSILAARKSLLDRLGGGPPTPAARPRTLNDLSQLPLAVPASAPPPRPATAGRPWITAVQRELDRLMPPRFLETTSPDRLVHLPRYLKALQLRLERAAQQPARDAERIRLLAPYETAASRLVASPAVSDDDRRRREEFLGMLEEFKVSVFAQELGTVLPVSATRLDVLLAELRGAS